jgi:LacI family transcriptional regulator
MNSSENKTSGRAPSENSLPKTDAPTKRATVADVAEYAQVSVATVDRVINQRAPVKEETTQRVLQAAKALNFRATRLIYDSLAKTHKEYTVGIILQGKSNPFYRLLGESFTEAGKRPSSQCRVEICYLDDLSTKSVVDAITKLASYTDVVGVVTADHPQINEAIEIATNKGTAVFSLISPINSPQVKVHLGVNTLKFGRTAGWYIANLCHTSGTIGVIIGSHRYQCQEVYLASFTSFLHKKRPDLKIVDTVISLESASLAQQATEELISQYPDLVGIYCIGSGIEGVIEALRFDNSHQRIKTICHELTEVTEQALKDEIIHVVMSNRRSVLAEKLLKAVTEFCGQKDQYEPHSYEIPFDVYCSENV